MSHSHYKYWFGRLSLIGICFCIPLLVIYISSVLWHSTSANSYKTAYDISHGQQLFNNRCSRCHDTEKGMGRKLGPSLTKIGFDAETRRPSLTAVNYLHESITEPSAFKEPGQSGSMPARLVSDFSDKDLRDLLAYLLSLQGKSSDGELSKIINKSNSDDPENKEAIKKITRQEIEFGESIFRGKGQCIQCHALYSKPEYHTMGPDLFWHGYIDEELIRKHIIEPNFEVVPKYSEYQVELVSGNILSGHIVKKTNKSVTMSILSNNSRQIIKVPIAEIEIDEDGKLLISNSPQSPMPIGFDKILSENELQAVVSFLRAMN